MDFFRSVFPDDPEPEPETDNSRDPMNNSPPSSPHSTPGLVDDEDDDSNRSPNPSPTAWSFGGLVKTLTSKSESAIQTYRRELEDLKSGLEKETAVIRGVASRAVENLPVSLDAGATVAQESLESVGQAIDDLGSSVWRGTAEIISRGRQTLLASSDPTGDYFDGNTNHQLSNPFGNQGSRFRRYSRFDAQLRAIQCNMSTYTQEPEDLSNFDQWKLGFDLDDKGREIDILFQENPVMESIYRKLVPGTVDRESFWSRYFYIFHKLRLAEDARASLVKKAVSGEEEELSWDVDDDDDDDDNVGDESNKVTSESESVPNGDRELEKNSAENLQDGVDELDVSKTNSDRSVAKADVRFVVEGKKSDVIQTSKDSDLSVLLSQASLPEEDNLEWDEIENGGSSDEGKVTCSGGGTNRSDKVTSGGDTNRSDLRNRLGAAEDDEDLSWDIEDDEEPVKS